MMVELGTRCTTERVQVGNSSPKIARAWLYSTTLSPTSMRLSIRKTESKVHLHALTLKSITPWVYKSSEAILGRFFMQLSRVIFTRPSALIAGA